MASAMETNEFDVRDVDRLVSRGGKFLRAVGTNADIQRTMYTLGYSREEHQVGWQLFLALCGFEPAPAQVDTHAAADAIAELDAWDGPHFRRARAALSRLFPAQEAYLFNGLDPATGVGAVVSVKTLLDRVAVLRGGDATRAATREQDSAAVTLLEQRRILGTDIEAHLRALIARATALPDGAAPLPVAADLPQAAMAFRAWLNDWRTTASVGISRRDYRIMLGIATRRRGTSVDDDEGTDVVEPSAATPAAPTAPSKPAAAPLLGQATVA